MLAPGWLERSSEARRALVVAAVALETAVWFLAGACLLVPGSTLLLSREGSLAARAAFPREPCTWAAGRCQGGGLRQDQRDPARRAARRPG